MSCDLSGKEFNKPCEDGSVNKTYHILDNMLFQNGMCFGLILNAYYTPSSITYTLKDISDNKYMNGTRRKLTIYR